MGIEKTKKEIWTAEQLAAARRYLESDSILVRHSHSRAGVSPTQLMFDDFSEFETYLRTSARPGDAIDVWPFPKRWEERIAHGKIPNEHGDVPDQGIY